MDIPLTTDQITADWVGHALARAGICDADDVASVRVEANPVDISGVVGNVVRLRLRYNGGAPGCPRTVIAKFPTSTDAIRDSVAAAGIYKVESDVYGLFATEIGLPVPRCYLAAESTGTGRFTFLLEDISPARSGGINRHNVRTC